MNVNQINGKYENQFEELNLLGGGGFGSVFKVYSIAEQTHYAVKKVQLRQQQKREECLKEVAFLIQLKGYEFIVQYFCHWMEKIFITEILHIKMQLCDMSLGKVVKKLKMFANDKTQTPYVINPFIYDIATELFLQIVSGLNYIHQLSIVHRDIKPENILISLEDKANFIKISDFGLAVNVKDIKIADYSGTPRYKGPDFLCGFNDTRIDLFSLGIVAEDLYCFTINEITDICNENKDIYDLMIRLVEVEYKKRGTCEEILRNKNKLLKNSCSDELKIFLQNILKEIS